MCELMNLLRKWTRLKTFFKILFAPTLPLGCLQRHCHNVQVRCSWLWQVFFQWSGIALGYFTTIIVMLNIFLIYKAIRYCTYINWFNPLSANPIKWSNTLKQFVRNSRRIVWMCLTNFEGLAFKGLSLIDWLYRKT